MVSSLAPESHSSHSCLRVIFRNWSLWSIGPRKPGCRIVRRPLNNSDTYYSVSEIHLETLQHRQGNTMYILTGQAKSSGWPRIHIPGHSAGTFKKATLQKLLLLSLPPSSIQAALLNEQWQWKWVVQLMKFLACLMSIKNGKNEFPWNLW